MSPVEPSHLVAVAQYTTSTRTASPSCPAAIGPAPPASPPAVPAALASLWPPYASSGNTATRLPRSAAWWASWRHCCCPAASAARVKTNTARWQWSIRGVPHRVSRARVPR